ncbi:MAG: hypothetical protein ACR2QK_20900 [Acidimicrobiales bacterium]
MFSIGWADQRWPASTIDRSGKRLGAAAVKLVLSAGLGLIATSACTDGESGDQGLGSDTTVGDQGGDIGSDRRDSGTGRESNGSERGGAAGDSGSTGTSTITPDDVFQRLPGEEFGDASDELVIEDAVAFDDRSWLFAGSLEDGRQRTIEATLSLVSSDDPAADRRIPLPADGAERSQANGVSISGDTILVAGLIGTGDENTPVVWQGDRSLGRWQLIELPTAPGSQRSVANRVYQHRSGDYVLGQAQVDGFSRPAAWRRTAGDWVALEADGEREEDLSASAGVVTGDGLVVIGRASAASGDPRPMVWIEQGDRLVTAPGDGLPTSGSLYDVDIDGGEVVAVGAATEDGISVPLVARSSDSGRRWTVQTAAGLDLAGWVSFDGVEFGRLLVDDGVLHTWLTNPVVQQMSRSVDGGRTWDRIGNLSLAGNNFVPANAVAARADGTILVTGADVAMEWPGSRSGGRSDSGSDTSFDSGFDIPWTTIVAADVLPTQLGALEAIDVVAGDDGFLIGGVRTARTDSDLRFEAVLWRSPDGTRWGRPPIDQQDGFAINDVFVDPDGRLGGFKAGGSYFTSVTLVRPDDGGRWRSTALPIGEAFLHHSLPGAGGAVVAAGNRPRSDLSQTDPLFVVIDSDGELREIPLTNSPVEPDTNASVLCLAGPVGRMISVLEWGDGQIGIATSTNGERWRGLPVGDDLDGLAINGCHGDEDGFLLGGRDPRGRAVVARSSDGEAWDVSELADGAAILGIDVIDGRIFLSGWITGDDGLGRDATIWKPDRRSWTPLIGSGLEGDGFARFTEVSALAARDGIVVAVGTDRGRAGAWVATVEVLSR